MIEFSILIIVMNPWAQILLLVSALTIKSEFFLNLPYKDWIVCKDVFQVNAQIVPEIV